MKILLNCSTLTTVGGIQVAHSFINEIKSIYNEELIVVCSKELMKQLETKDFPGNFIFFTYNIKANPLNVIFGSNVFLDNIINKYAIDRVFTLFGPSYWRPNTLHVCGFAKPQYIYKDSPFYKVIHLKDRAILSIKEFFHMLDFRKNAEILITENPDVSNKLRSLINKDVFTVTNNYNQLFDDESKWDQSFALPPFDGIYLLTLSDSYPHKNLSIIPQVIEKLKILSPSFNFKFVLTLLPNDLPFNPVVVEHIIFIGRVNVNQIPTLYKQTHFMFLPTLLECFSASYAEAMRMGKPILTSDLDFAKGICREAAVYFDPLDANNIARTILNLSNDIVLQEKLIKNGHLRLKDFDTARQRAIKYLEIITL